MSNGMKSGGSCNVGRWFGGGGATHVTSDCNSDVCRELVY